jgi:axial budding pattern protein 2
LNSDDDVGKSPSGDELRMGVHYMQSLGEGHSGLIHPSLPSLESLNDSIGKNALRTLVRVGEKFVFRVPVLSVSPTLSRARVSEVKLISGEPLPAFLHVDTGEIAKGIVTFSGVPTAADLGEKVVGVFTSEGVCASQMVLEVVKWR